MRETVIERLERMYNEGSVDAATDAFPALLAVVKAAQVVCDRLPVTATLSLAQALASLLERAP